MLKLKVNNQSVPKTEWNKRMEAIALTPSLMQLVTIKAIRKKASAELLHKVALGFDRLLFVGFRLRDAAKPVGKLHKVQSTGILDR